MQEIFCSLFAFVNSKVSSEIGALVIGVDRVTCLFWLIWSPWDEKFLSENFGTPIQELTDLILGDSPKCSYDNGLGL